MNAIRIRRRIDSEDLHLPELRSMIGKDVEITVVEELATPPADLALLDAAAGKIDLDWEAIENLRDVSKI